MHGPVQGADLPVQAGTGRYRLLFKIRYSGTGGLPKVSPHRYPAFRGFGEVGSKIHNEVGNGGSGTLWHCAIVRNMKATGREFQTVHPRLPVDLHRRVTEYAERTHRNLSNAIVHLLEAGLRAEEGK